MKRSRTFLFAGLLGMAATASAGTSLMENLDRGVVAIPTSSSEVRVAWRLLGTDPSGVTFNLYRSSDGGGPVLLNSAPLSGGTNFVDATVDLSAGNVYSVRAVVGGSELAAGAGFDLPAGSEVLPYLRVPLQVPVGGTTPDAVDYTYLANDCSVGDLDGDGDYEIVVKWEPSNAKDNSSWGYTGNVLLDAYQLDGTRLWRIDLGINIRAGAHYTQFMVYDLDGDGRAEIACRTAEGSRDATGTYVADASRFAGTRPDVDHTADRRNDGGYILGGPEFLTVFDGLTGAELTSTNYNPPRHPDTLFPTTAQIKALWGDDYGNRIDRFLAGIAYLDGRRPSLVMCRGYYTRTVLVAYDFRDGQLTQRWIFDTNPEGGAAGPYGAFAGQGNHNLTVADVDGDGRDEIVYGSCTIDDDGRGLYNTQLGHGDALHVTDLDPNRPGLEVWAALENGASTGIGHSLRDAATGAILFSVPSTNDAGRAMAADIDPAYPGYEMWGARGTLYDAQGNSIGTTKPSMNFGIWWDGDLQRELLDGSDNNTVTTPPVITKWNPTTQSADLVLSAEGCYSNNSTKATPNLVADILGDWREEAIWREADNSALRIYVSTTANDHRLVTLMHDRQYRESVAWQNIGYNQPPYPSFYLGEGMATPAAPDIVTSLADLPDVLPAVVSIQRYSPAAATIAATSATYRVVFNTPVTGVDVADFLLTTTNTAAGTVASVTTLSGSVYDVMVTPISGLGDVRLDLAASGTGITDADGAPIADGFTTGEAYTRATFAWIDPLGGAWSDAGNWEGGGIADGADVVADFSTIDPTGAVTVSLDSARLLSGMKFDDTNSATVSSWTIDNGGIASRALTLDVASGSPTITVGNTTATILAPLAGTDGLAKAGSGTLELDGASSLTGTIAVTGGTLRIGSGGSLAIGNKTVNASSGTRMEVAGGSFSTGGLVTVVTSTFAVSDGEVAFNAGFRTNSDSAGRLLVTGGHVTATDINIRRNSAGTPDYTTGFVVQGGAVDVGTVWLGNVNSFGAMSVENGSVTATGAVTLGNNGSNSARGGAMRVTGGELTVSDTTDGLVMVRANNNVSHATISGGVTTLGKLTFGYSSSVAAGVGNFTLSGGELYLGSGGMEKRASGTYAANINLNGGILGAAADWSSTLPLTVGGSGVELRAADVDGNARDVSLNGAIGGSGSIVKTGEGALELGGVCTNTGPLTVQSGLLFVSGSLAAGGTLEVGDTAILLGNGTIGKSTVLKPGATAAAYGTLTLSDVTWNQGATLMLRVGPSGDRFVMSGALTKGSEGVGGWPVRLNLADDIELGVPYTLATFASTDFTAADFVPLGVDGVRLAVEVGETSIQLVSFGSGAEAAYLEWSYNMGLTVDAANMTEDPDADGVGNLLEFVLATDPLSAGPMTVEPFTIDDAGVLYPAIRFTRRQDLGSAAVSVATSASPSFDDELGSVEVSASDRGDGVDVVEVRSTVPLADQSRQFMRVVVSNGK